MLEDLKLEILVGRKAESAWELFRLQHFPGRDHDKAAVELCEWASKNGIAVEFFTRVVRDREIIFIALSTL